MKEEFERQQRSGNSMTGLASALTGGGGGSGFDAAGWLAGSSAKEELDSATKGINPSGKSSGTEGKSGKKRRG